MTEKQLAANRRNALKSTGAKSKGEKARSSRNSLKRGALTAAPILPGVESREAWEEHRAGVLKSLAPVGYLENLLAVRLAIVSWRLSRVVRYEAEVAAAAIATAEPDLEESSVPGHGKPRDPDEARIKAGEASLIAKMLKTLPNMADGERLNTDVAVAALWLLTEQLPDDRDPVSVPGIPDGDEEFDAFDSWTAGLLRKAIEVYAATARMAPEAMRKQCIVSAGENYERAAEEERDLEERGQLWKQRLEQENRRRMLLDPDVLAKVTRYESNLERSFFKTLHEIQRLQAFRAGVDVPVPAAMDVDLNVHPEGPM